MRQSPRQPENARTPGHIEEADTVEQGRNAQQINGEGRTT